eukprot:TRINITY_DN5271_c0_g1_i1.p1 TRINITY_DN5271_c0_g1~~TRINITY_DN5271_c0_g1_i1.p1  ORF type:complete len:122 (-),score=19.57 TRINITY_DN5271_c0_g1_i1:158-523(-)
MSFSHFVRAIVFFVNLVPSYLTEVAIFQPGESIPQNFLTKPRNAKNGKMWAGVGGAVECGKCENRYEYTDKMTNKNDEQKKSEDQDVVEKKTTKTPNDYLLYKTQNFRIPKRTKILQNNNG